MTEVITDIPSRIRNAAVDQHGNRLPVAGAADIYDDALQMSQAAINQKLNDEINEIIAGSAKYSLSASPATVFVGDSAVTIALAATSDVKAAAIQIKKGDTVLASGTDSKTLSGSDSITPSAVGTTNYAAVFNYSGTTKTASASVVAVLPVSYGAGASYAAASLTQLQTPVRTPAGTYSIAIGANQHIYFKVQSSMNISKVETVGDVVFAVEMKAPVTDGDYKYYESVNTFDAGTYQFKVS